ncbi:MAG: hypothetical protein WC655_13585 [Candidatus Hydrogenedentales bacterium]|jgi:hypothetical protein
MKIIIEISIPAGLESARKNRATIRQAASSALYDLIGREQETEKARIISDGDDQIGEISCSVIYPDGPPPPRRNYGVIKSMRADRAVWANVETPNYQVKPKHQYPLGT